MTELAAAEGLEYHLDRTRGGNSFDAHRLIHLAAAHGLQDAAQGAPDARLLHRGPSRSATPRRSCG